MRFDTITPTIVTSPKNLPCYTTADEAAGKPLPIDRPRQPKVHSGYRISPEKQAALDRDLDLIINNYPAFLAKQNAEYEQMVLDLDNITFDSEELSVAASVLRKQRKQLPLFKE